MANDKARNEAQNANRLLYIANMNLAQQAYDNNNIARVLDLLAESNAGPKHAFEWGYWERECHLDLETLKGNRSHVTAALYLSDGRRVVTARLDHTVRIWDSVTGRQIGRPLVPMRSSAGAATSLSLSGDGSRLAIGFIDQTVEIWDARQIRPLRSFPMPGVPILSVGLNHDGSRVVASGGDRRSISAVNIWNVNSGQLLRQIPLKAGMSESCVQFSPDGRLVAAGGSDRIVHVVDPGYRKRDAHARRAQFTG